MFFTLNRHLRRQLDAIQRRLNEMPTRDELDAAKAELKQAISDAAGRVSTDIQALKDELATGNPVTQQDLDDLKADVDALGQIDAAPSPAPAPATP